MAQAQAKVKFEKVETTESQITKKDDKEDTSAISSELTSAASLFELFSMAEPLDYLLMFCGTLGAIVTGISLPFFNVLFGRMLDALNADPSSFEVQVRMIALSFVGVAGANVISGYCQVACWSITGERQTQKFRERYVRAVLSQEIGWFDTIGANELSTKVGDNIGKVSDGIGRKVGDLLQYISQFIGAFIVGFYLCAKLTAVLLASLPLIGGAGYFMITAITAALTQSLSQYAKAGGVATEALGSIRTVSALNAQIDIINKYRILLLEAMQVGIRKGLNVGLGNGSVFGACFGTYALGFWYGGKLVADDLAAGCGFSNNCITGGTILSVFFSVIMGSIALGQIAPPLSSFTSARAAAKPIIKILKRKPLIDGLSTEGFIPEETIKGNIKLTDVVFAYPSRPGRNICNGYNLEIEAGETVALVGHSGCGKSTIVNLLLRFYDPQNGIVSLDGLDIKDLNTRWLRSQMGYVGQEPILFSGTIADNIAYGIDRELLRQEVEKGRGSSIDSELLSDEILRQRIIAAAQLANAHDFISEFPNGYDTDVGSNGIALSGGQKQRIAIARAIISRPKVLLLDEATSALDASSERIVQMAIDILQQSKSQTTIVIAHRLSTIRNADKICVVGSEGKIVEIGRHEELLERDGLYADLVRLQLSTGVDSASEELLNLRSQNSASEFSNLMNSSMMLSQQVSTGAINVDEEGNNSKSSPKFLKQKRKDKNLTDDEKSKDVIKLEEELSKEEASRVSKRIWGMILKHKLWFLLAILGAAVFGAIFPVWGLLLGKL